MRSVVLFLLPYPQHRAGSQRFRVEAYFKLLRDNHIAFDTNEFLDEKTWDVLHRKGSILKKSWAVLKGFFNRFFFIVCRARSYQYVFIHREAAPLGPPFFEWLLAKIFRRKIIYDFDDAIWIPNISKGNRIAGFLKCFWKVKWICRWSYKVSVGNKHFLGSYAQQFNKNVVYNPTCVDADKYNILSNQSSKPVTIGWSGSQSTLEYIELMLPTLKKLKGQVEFRVLLICNHRPEFKMESIDFLPWNEDTEVESLSQINIGIMPAKDDAWSEGKCGFKLIQYMALGIPAVSNPVGVNKTIVEHGWNGYLCQSEEEWIIALSNLVKDEEKRVDWGERGRTKVHKEFTTQANAANFLSLFS